MALPHLGNNGILEKVHAAGVVGRLREVRDRVAQTQCLERTELFCDLLRRAEAHAGTLALDLLVDLRLRHSRRDVVMTYPGQTLLDVLLGVTDDDVDVRRPGDLSEVTTYVGTVSSEDLALVLEHVGREVGVVRVLGGDAQGLLLATPGDPHGYAVLLRPGLGRPLKRAGRADRAVDLIVLAVQRGRSLGPHVAKDLNPFLEHPEPDSGRGKGPAADAIRTPLVLIPPGADAHLEAALGDDVDGRSDLCQIGGVAIPHAGAHLPEPDPAGA